MHSYQYYNEEMNSIDGFFHLMAIWALICIFALGIVWYDQSKVEDYDDSEYHYVMLVTRKLDLEIASYGAQLTKSEEFAHRMIEFYQKHKEYLYYEHEYYPDCSSRDSGGGS